MSLGQSKIIKNYPLSIGLNTIWLLMVVLISGCSTVFTSVEPNSGATCDIIEVQREEGRRHRCGIHMVEFDGRPAEGICLEGSGLSSCSPERSGDDLIFTIPESWPEGSGTLSVEQSIRGTGCALLGTFGSDRYEFPFTVTEQRRSPVITSFTADDPTITAGDSTTLRWNVTGTTTSVQLDAGAVPASGTRTITPDSTQTYRLTAENDCLSSFGSVTVCVNTPQAAPVLTSVDSARPGGAFRANGRNLTYNSCAGAASSSLVFTQGGTTLPAVVDASPGDRRMDVTLPAAMMPGDATVAARVGTMTSEPFAFTVEGRRDGDFRPVTLRQSGTFPCGSSGRTLTVTSGSGSRRTAEFRQGSTTLASFNFDIGTGPSGAAVSPGCEHAVVVGQNTTPGTGDVYSLNIYDLEDGPSLSRVRQTNLGTGVQVLFSQDDSVALYKAQDNSAGGAGFAAISLHDMERRRAISGPAPGITCSMCNSINANITMFNDINVIFDGRSLGGPYPIE